MPPVLFTQAFDQQLPPFSLRSSHAWSRRAQFSRDFEGCFISERAHRAGRSHLPRSYSYEIRSHGTHRAVIWYHLSKPLMLLTSSSIWRAYFNVLSYRPSPQRDKQPTVKPGIIEPTPPTPPWLRRYRHHRRISGCRHFPRRLVIFHWWLESIHASFALNLILHNAPQVFLFDFHDEYWWYISLYGDFHCYFISR